MMKLNLNFDPKLLFVDGQEDVNHSTRFATKILDEELSTVFTMEVEEEHWLDPQQYIDGFNIEQQWDSPAMNDDLHSEASSAFWS